jgi:ABC-type transporter MlaC component
MKKISILLILISISASSLLAQAGSKDPVETVKKMVGAIRYKKNQKALTFIDTEIFSKNLLKGEYESLKPEEKKDFENAVKEFISHKSFATAHHYFHKIDMNYEKPIITGKEARVPSSILHNGSEKIQFSWILFEKDGKYLVTDFFSEGKLASETTRTEQVIPLLKKEGIAKVIEAIKKAAK